MNWQGKYFNNQEANTRMILFASLEDLSDNHVDPTKIVVVSKDTDVLVLLVYIYAGQRIVHEDRHREIYSNH